MLRWWCYYKGPTCQCRCKRCRFNPWVGKIPWRKEWQPTPVFLPGESHGQRSLEGYSPQGHKESDMTKQARMPFLWLPSPNSHWLLSLLCLKRRDPVIAWCPRHPPTPFETLALYVVFCLPGNTLSLLFIRITASSSRLNSVLILFFLHHCTFS